ncbi:MAG: hypothetical protein R2744_13320 [Bacteroidales bacterium]
MLLTVPESNIHVIITMRSDFIGECAHFQGLTELINNSNYLVPHMSSGQLPQAIIGPVYYAGAGIEEDLVNRLREEIGEKTDSLSVMQHEFTEPGITGRKWVIPAGQSLQLIMIQWARCLKAMSRHANGGI